MNPIKWLYEQTLRNTTIFFTVVWFAIGTAAHDLGLIGAFIYMPILYLATVADSIKRNIADDNQTQDRDTR